MFVRKIQNDGLHDIEAKEKKHWKNTLFNQKTEKPYDLWLKKADE